MKTILIKEKYTLKDETILIKEKYTLKDETILIKKKYTLKDETILIKEKYIINMKKRLWIGSMVKKRIKGKNKIEGWTKKIERKR